MACNGNDRRQRRKQGVAVGTAASRMQGSLKGRRMRWEPQPVFVSEEEASRLMTVYNNQYNQKAEATLQLLRLFLCLKN